MCIYEADNYIVSLTNTDVLIYSKLTIAIGKDF